MRRSKSKNIVKKDIIRNINNYFGSSVNFADRFLETTIDIILDQLNYSKKLKIKNFGIFKILEKKARIGRNPKSKIEHLISERKVVTFKASLLLKQKINKIR